MKKVILFLSILLLAGCSNKPSDSDISAQISQVLLANGADEFFTVDEVQKTNGFEKNKDTYIADIQYTLTFKVNADEAKAKLKQSGSLQDMMQMMMYQMQYGDFKAGAHITKEEKVTFIHTENGWQIQPQQPH